MAACSGRRLGDGSRSKGVAGLRHHLITFAHEETRDHPIKPGTLQILRRAGGWEYRRRGCPHIESVSGFGLDQFIRLSPIHHRRPIVVQPPFRHRFDKERRRNHWCVVQGITLTTVAPTYGIGKMTAAIIQQSQRLGPLGPVRRVWTQFIFSGKSCCEHVGAGRQRLEHARIGGQQQADFDNRVGSGVGCRCETGHGGLTQLFVTVAGLPP